MTKTTPSTTDSGDSGDDDPLLFSQPDINDGAEIYQLIKSCPPLDLNSNYVYLLLCAHFAQSCIIVRKQHQLVGFISAYIHPQKPHTLFVWQVAVHKDARGLGLAAQMVDQLLQRPALQQVRYVETTVDPENDASRRLFEKVAQNYRAPLQETPFFEAHHFVEPQVEPLLCIGPLQKNTL